MEVSEVKQCTAKEIRSEQPRKMAARTPPEASQRGQDQT